MEKLDIVIVHCMCLSKNSTSIYSLFTGFVVGDNSWRSRQLSTSFVYRVIEGFFVFNPWRACAAGLQYLGVFVCSG